MGLAGKYAAVGKYALTGLDSRLRGEAPLALDKRARGNDAEGLRKKPDDSFIIAFSVHDRKIYENQLWR